MNEDVKAGSSASAGLVAGGGVGGDIEAPYFTFTVECRDADGNVKWTEVVRNTVTTVGKTDILDKYFKGSGYTAAWYCGLISSVSYSAPPAAGDTMASHSNWTEAGGSNAPPYSQGTRPAFTFGTASGGSLSTSSASVFSITNTGTVKGAFVVNNSTKDGPTGTLYSGALFTGGDRAVINGDTLNVSATLTVS